MDKRNPESEQGESAAVSGVGGNAGGNTPSSEAAESREARFALGDVFPPDDLVGEWLVAVGIAANDLIAVHTLETDDDSLRWYYLRIAAGHFYEVGKHLHRAREVDEIKRFVASLDFGVRESYERALSVWAANEDGLRKLRNAVFHYPSLMNRQELDKLKAKRELPPVLKRLRRHKATLRYGLVRDLRFTFADEISAEMTARMVGGEKNFFKLDDELRAGIEAFMRFATPAVLEHLSRRHDDGVSISYG